MKLISKLEKLTRYLLLITIYVVLFRGCSYLLPPIPSISKTVQLQGEINSSSISAFLLDLKIASTLPGKKISINIDSGGGSVFAGHRAIKAIRNLQGKGYYFSCHANFAASMAFTILQYCDLRTADSDSIIMQHMIHNGNGREAMSFRSNEERNTIQFLDGLHGKDEAERLGISYVEYTDRYMFSKWYKGNDACEDMVVDLVHDYKTGKTKVCLLK